jgi:predicted RNA-binding Zn-ribbon protein involved in translation (DUF1610 family)
MTCAAYNGSGRDSVAQNLSDASRRLLTMENFVCAFCGQKIVPKRDNRPALIEYRCDKCGSLVAAYGSEFEEHLRLGKLFNQYSVDKYLPELPTYIKTVKTQSK